MGGDRQTADIMGIVGPSVGAAVGLVATGGNPMGAAVGAGIGSSATSSMFGEPSGEGGLGQTSKWINTGGDLAGMIGGMGMMGGAGAPGAGSSIGGANSMASIPTLSMLLGSADSPTEAAGMWKDYEFTHYLSPEELAYQNTLNGVDQDSDMASLGAPQGLLSSSDSEGGQGGGFSSALGILGKMLDSGGQQYGQPPHLDLPEAQMGPRYVAPFQLSPYTPITPIANFPEAQRISRRRY